MRYLIVIKETGISVLDDDGKMRLSEAGEVFQTDNIDWVDGAVLLSEFMDVIDTQTMCRLDWAGHQCPLKKWNEPTLEQLDNFAAESNLVH